MISHWIVLPRASASADGHDVWVSEYHALVSKSAPGAPAPAPAPTAAETAKAATRQTAQQKLDALTKPGPGGKVAPYYDQKLSPAERTKVNAEVTSLYRSLNDSPSIENVDDLPPLSDLRQATGVVRQHFSNPATEQAWEEHMYGFESDVLYSYGVREGVSRETLQGVFDKFTSWYEMSGASQRQEIRPADISYWRNSLVVDHGLTENQAERLCLSFIEQWDSIHKGE